MRWSLLILSKDTFRTFIDIFCPNSQFSYENNINEIWVNNGTLCNLPSLDPVVKYLESCVQLQHQIILECTPLALFVVAAKTNCSWLFFSNNDHLLSLETVRIFCESGENAIWETVKLWDTNFCIFFQLVVSLWINYFVA